MKKTAIALLVAGFAAAPIAAQADATVYGSARIAVSSKSFDEKNAAGQTTGDVDSGLTATDHASRFGLKGSEDLGNGMKMVGRYEFKVNGGTAQINGGAGVGRLSYVGLEGGFGGLYIGQQWSPFYELVGGATDQFNAVGLAEAKTTVRIPAAVKYVGSFGPLKVSTAIVSVDNTDGEDIDQTQFGAAFSMDSLTLAAAVVSNAKETAPTGGADGSLTGFSAKYSADAITVNASYTVADDKYAGAADDQSAFEIYGGYNMGAGNLVHASFGSTDSGDVDADSSTFAIGYQKKFSKRSRVWVEAQNQTRDGKSDTGNDLDDLTTVSVGMRHDW